MAGLVEAVVLAAVIAGQVPAPDSGRAAAKAIASRLKQIVAEERAELMVEARRLEASERHEAAARVKQWAAADETGGAAERFVPLEEFVPRVVHGLASLPEGDDTAVARAMRRKRAEALYSLANDAVAPGVEHFALADRLLRAVVARDGDHAEARRLLGFVPFEGGWATPFAADQLRAGKVLHEVYDWVPQSWVEHLERGELPGTSFNRDQPREWLPAAHADALRSRMDERPWRITTEHFEIQTNVPLNEAIAFGKRLEEFHQLFFGLLGDVIGKERLPLAQRIASGKSALRASEKRYEVWYFAEKAEYVDYFRRKFRRDESESLGYYMPSAEARGYRSTPRSYFYRDHAGAIDSESTLFHEASHQLLFESAGPSRLERNRGNFWVWEGLGTYFETVRRGADGVFEVGGRVGPRWDDARRRMIDGGEMVPLPELVAMGRDTFQGGDSVRLHYGEAMALAIYLMNGESGRFRDGFLDYVADAYAGRLSGGQSLALSLGISYEELEAGLRAFLGSSDTEPRS
jgi:hypothetical protein